MTEKRAMDLLGAASLVGIAGLLGFNQVVIKVTAAGFDPVFQAGLRSAIGVLLVLGWMRLKSIPLRVHRSALWPGVVAGLFFAAEFLCLYIALDLTTVSRASLIFYSMPAWLAVFAHVLLPGERLNGVRVAGLVLAMSGVALAVLDRQGGEVNLAGDLLALMAALFWAAIPLCVRMTPLAHEAPERQLLLQVVVSAPLLLLAAPAFGPLLRAPEPLHVAGLAFQVVAVVGLCYLAWFHLLATYRANAVASFSFLSPVLAVLLGWLVLGEQVGARIWLALALVAAGLVLINRR